MMNSCVLNSPWKQNGQIMSSHTVLLVSIYITDLVPADTFKQGLKLPRDSHSCYLLFTKYPLWAGDYYGVGEGITKKDKRKWQWKYQALPGGSDSKESTCNAGDLGSIPGSRGSPGVGHGNLLQYSCLENPHGQRSCSPGVTKSGRGLISKHSTDFFKLLLKKKN